MDTWISDTRPLLSLVFPFLTHCEQQRWRLAGSFAREKSNEHIAPVKWRDVVLSQSNVESCPLCPQIHLIKKMFYCSVCRQYSCGNHVMSCNVCMYDLCSNCAYEKQCNMCQWPEFSIHYS